MLDVKKIKLSRRSKKLLFLNVALAFCMIYCRPPSEKLMISNFYVHRAEFEKLHAMLGQDTDVQSIGIDWINDNSATGPETLPTARLDEYRRLMRLTGVRMVARDHNNRNRFGVFGGGFTDTAWSVGYAWSGPIPEHVVASAYNIRPGRDQTDYSHITGHWYLYQLR